MQNCGFCSSSTKSSNLPADTDSRVLCIIPFFYALSHLPNMSISLPVYIYVCVCVWMDGWMDGWMCVNMLLLCEHRGMIPFSARLYLLELSIRRFQVKFPLCREPLLSTPSSSLSSVLRLGLSITFFSSC